MLRHSIISHALIAGKCVNVRKNYQCILLNAQMTGRGRKWKPFCYWTVLVINVNEQMKLIWD